MMIAEDVYLCIQGEGLLVGTPSVLVRTSGCNLRCNFKNGEKCDSSFTWMEQGKKVTIQEVYDEVIKLATHGKNQITNIILSGGEPTLFGTEFNELCRAFLLSGFHVTVETNGTKYAEIPTKIGSKGKERDLTPNLLFSISPKLKSSVPVGTEFEKNHEKTRINLVVLEALLKRYPSYLKFVITGDEDLEEVLELQKSLKLSNHRIFLMPEGTNRDVILEKSKALVDTCLKYNFRFSPREHVNIWGNKRGV